MNRQKDMLLNLRSKVTQMASSLSMSTFANRDSFVWAKYYVSDAMSRTTGLDNTGNIGLRRQIMRCEAMNLPSETQA
ncbi:hypothetical protein Vadar_031806 [Vaccinium darrowii]|uniref:Uncharacterized protein n=1 Tax=Vaccinium darrowii TaxID=229202 RepID=A0ACB7XDR9_9ERIC|nr:hypothetical protein Vadar_031806 [Vaccinium darrowii]